MLEEKTKQLPKMQASQSSGTLIIKLGPIPILFQKWLCVAICRRNCD